MADRYSRINYKQHRRQNADKNGYILSSRWDDEKVKDDVIKMYARWDVRTVVKTERAGLGIDYIWDVYEHVADMERAEQKAKQFAQPHFPGQEISAILGYDGMMISVSTGAFKNWAFPVRIDTNKRMRLIGLEQAKKTVKKPQKQQKKR